MKLPDLHVFLRYRLRKIWPGLPSTWVGLRRSVGDAAVDVARLTTGSVLAYMLTVWLLPPPVDLTGALTALLVIQASLRGSFQMGLVRVGAVLTGILTALFVATFVGLHWWSLAIVVFVSLMLARVLRLGDQTLETPISAMLILGSMAATETTAYLRFTNTLIGTAVGIILPFLWPRRVRTADLTTKLDVIGDRLSQTLRSAANRLKMHPVNKTAAHNWVLANRQIMPIAVTARARLDEAAEVAKFNTLQLYRADVVPLLRYGLDCLERVNITILQIWRGMEEKAPTNPTPDDGYGDDVRQAFSDVLDDTADVVDYFVKLINAEADGNTAQAESDLSMALEHARAMHQELLNAMMVDPQESALWTLRGSILGNIERVLAEMDLDRYIGVRDRWRASQLGRSLPSGNIGPKLRTPRAVIAHHRLQKRAAAARLEHPEGSHEVSHDDTTVVMNIPPANETKPEDEDD